MLFLVQCRDEHSGWLVFQHKITEIILHSGSLAWKSWQELLASIVNSHELARATWIATIVVFHKKEQGPTILPFSCS